MSIIEWFYSAIPILARGIRYSEIRFTRQNRVDLSKLTIYDTYNM